MKQMSKQVSRGSAGDYQADEWQGSRGSAGDYQADERAGVVWCLWPPLQANMFLETIAKAGVLMIVTVSRHCFLSALLLAALCLMLLSTCGF